MQLEQFLFGIDLLTAPIATHEVAMFGPDHRESVLLERHNPGQSRFAIEQPTAAEGPQSRGDFHEAHRRQWEA